MANIPRPLPNILKAFIAEVEQVVANSEDRRDTIARLTQRRPARLIRPGCMRIFASQWQGSSCNMPSTVLKTVRYRSWPWSFHPAWRPRCMTIAPGV